MEVGWGNAPSFLGLQVLGHQSQKRERKEREKKNEGTRLAGVVLANPPSLPLLGLVFFFFWVGEVQPPAPLWRRRRRRRRRERGKERSSVNTARQTIGPLRTCSILATHTRRLARVPRRNRWPFVGLNGRKNLISTRTVQSAQLASFR